MKDRISAHPGRVKLLPVADQENTYDVVMDDDPLEEGDAPVKKNLLQDETCELLKLSHEAVPNDAFVALAVGLDRYGYKIHVSLPDGSPVSDATVVGFEGGELKTNENGYALGVSDSQSITLSVISPLIDVESASDKVVESVGKITPVEVVLTFNDKEMEITESNAYKHSYSVKSIDFSAVGGGGGGAGPGYVSSTWGDWVGGGGGGGGRVATKLGVSPGDDGTFEVQIGAGGSGSGGSSNGGAGGNTKVIISGATVIEAVGGGGGTYGNNLSSANAGGTGNGNGGNGHNNAAYATAGGNGQGKIFNDPDRVVGGGGGGGAGGQQSTSTTTIKGKPGGKPSGGLGCGHGTSENPTAGAAPGGGGGGGGFNRYSGSYGSRGGASGGRGALYVVFHH